MRFIFCLIYVFAAAPVAAQSVLLENFEGTFGSNEVGGCGLMDREFANDSEMFLSSGNLIFGGGDVDCRFVWSVEDERVRQNSSGEEQSWAAIAQCDFADPYSMFVSITRSGNWLWLRQGSIDPRPHEFKRCE